MILDSVARDQLIALVIDEFWSNSFDDDRRYVLRAISRFHAVPTGTFVNASDEPDDDLDDDQLTAVQFVARTAVYYGGIAALYR